QQAWTSQLAITKRNLVIPGVLAVLFLVLFFLQFHLSRFVKKLSLPTISFGVIIFVVTIFDLFYFFHKITPFSPKEYIYPSTSVVRFLQSNDDLYRFWGYGSAYIGSNFQAFDRTYSPEGEDPLHLRWYTELVESTENGQIPAVLPRPDANIASGYGVGHMEENPYRQKFLNLAGVKYIVHKDDSLGSEWRPETATFVDKKYKLVWQQSPWQ